MHRRVRRAKSPGNKPNGKTMERKGGKGNHLLTIKGKAIKTNTQKKGGRNRNFIKKAPTGPKKRAIREPRIRGRAVTLSEDKKTKDEKKESDRQSGNERWDS